MKFTLVANQCVLVYGDFTFFGDVSHLDADDMASLQVKVLTLFSEKDTEKQEEFLQSIQTILVPKLAGYKEAKKQIEKTVEILSDYPGFYQKGDFLYHEVSPLSIPAVLANKFAELIKEWNEAKGDDNTAVSPEVEKWINFWFWVSKNPDPESREDIYKWVKSHNIPVLNSGLILTFRRVVKVENLDYKLQEFVNTEFLKRKKNKKKTSVTVFYSEGEYNVEKGGTPQGKLNDLYNTKNEVYYTDNYSKTEKYYIGVENRKPRTFVDKDKSNTCSSGYHSAGRGFAYSGFGNTPVAVILNPADVLVVYENDYGKCRSCAFTIVGVLEQDAEWQNDKEMLDVISNVTNDQVERFKKLYQDVDVFDADAKNIMAEVNSLCLDVESFPTTERFKTILA